MRKWGTVRRYRDLSHFLKQIGEILLKPQRSGGACIKSPHASRGARQLQPAASLRRIAGENRGLASWLTYVCNGSPLDK